MVIRKLWSFYGQLPVHTQWPRRLFDELRAESGRVLKPSGSELLTYSQLCLRPPIELVRMRFFVALLGSTVNSIEWIICMAQIMPMFHCLMISYYIRNAIRACVHTYCTLLHALLSTPLGKISEAMLWIQSKLSNYWAMSTNRGTIRCINRYNWMYWETLKLQRLARPTEP